MPLSISAWVYRLTHTNILITIKVINWMAYRHVPRQCQHLRFMDCRDAPRGFFSEQTEKNPYELDDSQERLSLKSRLKGDRKLLFPPVNYAPWWVTELVINHLLTNLKLSNLPDWEAACLILIWQGTFRSWRPKDERIIWQGNRECSVGWYVFFWKHHSLWLSKFLFVLAKGGCSINRKHKRVPDIPSNHNI